MPVQFITPQQAERYGRFAGEPNPDQLAKYFHLDETDLKRITRRHADHNKLGFAVQLGTVRFLGTFLTQNAAIPPEVVAYLARQLHIADVQCLQRYRDDVRWRHLAEIKRLYGYRDFTERVSVFRLVRWLYTRATVGAESPSVLFDHATSWLIEHKVLLPGVSVLGRLVARIRDRAAAHLWLNISRIPSSIQRAQLQALLDTPQGNRMTELDRLRRSPTRVSTMGLIGAVNRLNDIRALGVGALELAHIPTGRLDALARQGYAVRAQSIARMREDRQVATLLAIARELEVRALDDALDLFGVFVAELLSKAQRLQRRRRLRTLKDLDHAALLLCEVYQSMMTPGELTLEAVRNALFGRIPACRLEKAFHTVQSLAQPQEGRYYHEVLERYRTARRILLTLLESIDFNANATGQSIVDALTTIFERRDTRQTQWRATDVPLAFVTAAWRRWVCPNDQDVDRRAYTLCALERLREGLMHHDIFVDKSRHWADPRAQLLRGRDWEKARPQICRMLRLSSDADEELALLRVELDQAYRATAADFDDNPAIRFEQQAGRSELVITPLDALDEPASLLRLRDAVEQRMPRADLPDLLLEVDAWTGFTHMFSHVSEGRARVDDIATSVCAVLIAEACNLGFEPIAQADMPALSRGRLSWIAQNYLRAETIAAANACLVDYHATIPLVTRWGGGDVASADGLRFVVPVRTINAGPNPRYFGTGRGVTYLNFISDQYAGFSGLVIPGTLRDSVYILEGLLQNETSLRPVQIMTDTASYSDLVFGLFRLLRYQFSPRLADAGDARFWRLDRDADYGPLNALGKHTIRTNLVRSSWDDMLRAAGSLVGGHTSAIELVRTLQGGGRPTTLGRAIAEYGRIPKTLHLLQVLNDEHYRRQMLVQLNRQEGRHSLARAVFHGKKGELRKRYREGQEDQLSALGLVVNAIVLWNTRYMELALAQLRSEGFDVRDEDVERLSPLAHWYINLQGRYYFGVPDEVTRGELRPLRRPEDAVNEL